MNAQDFGFIRDLMRKRSANVLEDGKEYLAEFRLGALAKREGLSSIGALVARLRAQPHDPLHQRVIEVMTTNETSFFRDGYPFDALREHVLPRLAARHAGDRRLSVWCAAASSGQEPYSVAILLRELNLSAPQWKVRFVASDLSREMTTRARQGIYSPLEIGRGLPPALLARYFRPMGAQFEISDDVKRMIEFVEINLCDPWPLVGQFDLIMLRNVLIYFDTETKREILRRMRRLLAPAGCLFLGAAETTLSLEGDLHKAQHGRASWYQASSQPL
jgi:chemotaxis protein methyltransferase CheR